MLIRTLALLCAIAAAAAPGAASAADTIPPGPGTPYKLQPGPDGIVTPPALTEWEYRGDGDAFRVYLPKGKTFGGWLYTYCKVGQVTWFDRNFRLLATATQRDQQHPAWAELTTPYDGLYYLQVNDITALGQDCSAQPGYLVAAVETCRAGRLTACWINPGTSVYATLWSPADKDWRTLTITTAGTYMIWGWGDRSGNAWDTKGVIGLRRADTSVITESGRDDGHQCYLGEACVRAKLEPGRYFVALRMPQLEHATRYQMAVTRER